MVWLGLLVVVVALVALGYRRNRNKWGMQRARRQALMSGGRILLLYLGVLGVLLWLENRLIYFPQTASQFWHPPGGLEKVDVQLSSKLGDQLHGWWCPQSAAKWTILFSHGNAGNLSGHAWIIPEIRAAMKANVFIYDYPGYGKSGGQPSEQGCRAAAEAGYEWLIQTQRVSPDHLVLMGQSLGCALACDLAERPHRAMVLLSPFTSIGDRGQELFPIFPVKWLIRHRYDNLSKLRHYEKPILIGHGELDEIIPIHHGERLFAAVGSSHKQFYRIEKGTHNELDAGFFRAMPEFLQRLEP